MFKNVNRLWLVNTNLTWISLLGGGILDGGGAGILKGGGATCLYTGGWGGGSGGLGPWTTATIGINGAGRRSICLSTIAKCSDGRIRRGGAGIRIPGITGSGMWERGRASGGRTVWRGGGAGARLALAASDSSVIGARQSVDKKMNLEHLNHF